MWSWQCQHGEDILHVPVRDLGTHARALLSLVLSTAPALCWGPQGQDQERIKSGSLSWWWSWAQSCMYTAVQFSSVTQSCPTPCNPMDCSTPDLPVHHQLPEFTQTHVHWVGDIIQPSHPLSSPSPPAFNLTSIRVFSNESVLCIRWSEYLNFSIRPSNEYSGLISFQIDWFDLFAVQGTLKSLLQHHSSKASILKCSAFFVVQLSH